MVDRIAIQSTFNYTDKPMENGKPLSLWLSSIKDEKKVKDEKEINDEKKTAAGLPRYNGVTENPINKRDDVRLRMEESKGKQSLRLLGFHTPALHQDLQWWLPKDLFRIFELRQLQERPDGVSDAESVLEMETHRTTLRCVDSVRPQCIGYGRQKWIQTYKPGTSGEAESPLRLSLFSRKSLLDETEDHGEHVCESGTILAAESYASLPLLFAQHIFSAFMHAVVSWDGPKELFHSVADVQPNTSGSKRNFVYNVREIESTGLGSLEDIYLSVLPPLSQNQKLPRADDAVIKLAREQARQHELLQHWQEATRIYLWLLQTANIFGGQGIVTKATAVVVEYLRQVSSTVDLRKAKDWSLERRVLEQGTEEIAKELNKYDNRDIMLSFMILYEERGYLEKRPEACEQKTKDRSCRDVALSDTSPDGNNRHPTAFSFITLQKTSACHREAADEVETSNRGRLDAKDIHHWTPLHELARTGRRFGIGMNFEEGAQESGGVSPRDLLDWTPLHLLPMAWKAQSRGGDRESIIYQLIHEGADINAQGRDGMIPLHCASIEGNSRAVAILIEAGANVDIQDASGTTPLLWAAYKGWEDIAKNLWEVANKRRRDIEGRTALHLAALSGQTPIVRWLVVDQGVEKEAQDSRMRRPLHWAVKNGHEEVAALLIEQKADKEAPDSPLHYAAARGYEQLIALLVDEGAETEAIGEQGRTPLYHAAEYGNVKAAEMLLKKGANIEATCGSCTPLHAAAAEGRAAVVALLIHQGAERDVVDDFGETPLHKAATSGSTETVACLIQEGADIEAKSKNGETPLHIAIEWKKDEIVHLLLRLGSNIEALGTPTHSWGGGYQLTPLHYAALFGCRRSARMLKDAGANTDVSDDTQPSRLSLAIKHGQTDIAKQFIEDGSCVHEKTLDGCTLLHYAVTNGDIKSLRLLLENGADKQVKDNEGRTALQKAFDMRQKTVEGEETESWLWAENLWSITRTVEDFDAVISLLKEGEQTGS
ncbi:ankyrin repeat protein [Colletotrichum asianum]